jgi:ABC-type uncharacterized transport system auxiliary subunit
MRIRRALCVAGLWSQVGCALLSKSDAFVARYFTPEVATSPAEPSAPGELELKLGTVNSAAYIKDDIVYRDSNYEVRYYEETRWTENPEVYVRRALVQALFARHGLRQIVYGRGTTLDVDVLAFEEVLAPRHVGRVVLAYSMVDDRIVRAARSIMVERPIANVPKDMAASAMVEALSAALADAAAAVADRAVGELRTEQQAARAANDDAGPPQ